jgi:NADPH-dependent 2,4-dienoyl-CoA reductase/sulfur reductase-like enzyme
MKYVVVGSGPAGISAAEEIRKSDVEGVITMITADPRPARSPVMLTYWMSGHTPEERLFFREAGSWAQDHQVDLRCGAQVMAIDILRQAVTLSTGDRIAYDRLLIATGATPLIPPIPGIRAKGVCTFRTFADAEEILSSHRDLERVCIMGGGFIGIKLACHLRERGLSVLVVEKEPRLASRIFDQWASDIVKAQLIEHGISVETGTGVAEVSAHGGWVSGVRLEDSRTFPTQILVVSVGVRPNTSFAGAPLAAAGGGIPVDERMETSVPHVYAAGDVAMTRDSITSAPFSNAVWPAATRQGKVAGANMAGGRRTYVHNFNLNALNLYGLQIASAGHSLEPEGDDIVVYREEQGGSLSVAQEDRDLRRPPSGYRKIVLRSGVPIGFILIGDVTPAGSLLSRMKRGDVVENPAELLEQAGHAPSGLPPQMGFRHGSLWPQC